MSQSGLIRSTEHKSSILSLQKKSYHIYFGRGRSAQDW
jgi:hypothetical protein